MAYNHTSVFLFTVQGILASLTCSLCCFVYAYCCNNNKNLNNNDTKCENKNKRNISKLNPDIHDISTSKKKKIKNNYEIENSSEVIINSTNKDKIYLLNKRISDISLLKYSASDICKNRDNISRDQNLGVKSGLNRKEDNSNEIETDICYNNNLSKNEKWKNKQNECNTLYTHKQGNETPYTNLVNFKLKTIPNDYSNEKNINIEKYKHGEQNDAINNSISTHNEMMHIYPYIFDKGVQNFSPFSCHVNKNPLIINEYERSYRNQNIRENIFDSHLKENTNSINMNSNASDIYTREDMKKYFRNNDILCNTEKKNAITNEGLILYDNGYTISEKNKTENMILDIGKKHNNTILRSEISYIKNKEEINGMESKLVMHYQNGIIQKDKFVKNGVIKSFSSITEKSIENNSPMTEKEKEQIYFKQKIEQIDNMIPSNKLKKFHEENNNPIFKTYKNMFDHFNKSMSNNRQINNIEKNYDEILSSTYENDKNGIKYVETNIIDKCENCDLDKAYHFDTNYCDMNKSEGIENDYSLGWEQNFIKYNKNLSNNKKNIIYNTSNEQYIDEKYVKENNTDKFEDLYANKFNIYPYSHRSNKKGEEENEIKLIYKKNNALEYLPEPQNYDDSIVRNRTNISNTENCNRNISFYMDNEEGNTNMDINKEDGSNSLCNNMKKKIKYKNIKDRERQLIVENDDISINTSDITSENQIKKGKDKEKKKNKNLQNKPVLNKNTKLLRSKHIFNDDGILSQGEKNVDSSKYAEDINCKNIEMLHKINDDNISIKTCNNGEIERINTKICQNMKSVKMNRDIRSKKKFNIPLNSIGSVEGKQKNVTKRCENGYDIYFLTDDNTDCRTENKEISHTSNKKKETNNIIQNDKCENGMKKMSSRIRNTKNKNLIPKYMSRSKTEYKLKNFNRNSMKKITEENDGETCESNTGTINEIHLYDEEKQINEFGTIVDNDYDNNDYDNNDYDNNNYDHNNYDNNNYDNNNTNGDQKGISGKKRNMKNYERTYKLKKDEKNILLDNEKRKETKNIVKNKKNETYISEKKIDYNNNHTEDEKLLIKTSIKNRDQNIQVCDNIKDNNVKIEKNKKIKKEKVFEKKNKNSINKNDNVNENKKLSKVQFTKIKSAKKENILYKMDAITLINEKHQKIDEHKCASGFAIFLIEHIQKKTKEDKDIFENLLKFILKLMDIYKIKTVNFIEAFLILETINLTIIRAHPIEEWILVIFHFINGNIKDHNLKFIIESLKLDHIEITNVTASFYMNKKNIKLTEKNMKRVITLLSHVVRRSSRIKIFNEINSDVKPKEYNTNDQILGSCWHPMDSDEIPK
ncbi:conserved Plasmodium protein, unknown function [Plasmodium yoelii]|uniref:Uncharacterized protein n=2 Tax=Plasmodium yoelii TaxID=5861 RepID=A0AAE9WUU0_PLAYO|nr:conserved Plasmodium protein, unknown function [Plasmodium yoelii]WBY60813.1 hypothetical protein Py17XNL_001401080 [Plasmodium yoelii yoelii]CDU20585.1 conserved Plasmodium protein, unknown function [Plasmodium yoelii]VTZ81546.1 conserved Plasmodium protein, unknown function [Plasmodium yoelii]|eukprot:XP_729028.2 conserved Plasmodium protein, unknown function [Plasmodium yoelii]